MRENIRRCAFFSTGRKHTGCGKSHPGKSQTMSLIFLPTQPFSKQRINSGVRKVVGSKQTYYGNRGDDGPRLSSCAVHGGQGWQAVLQVVGVTQLAPSFVQLSRSAVLWGCFKPNNSSCPFGLLLSNSSGRTLWLPRRVLWFEKANPQGFLP